LGLIPVFIQLFFIIGMAIRRHRHTGRHVNIPKESRTNIVFDERPHFKGDKDNGIFYRCWKCGQIFHDKTTVQGGSRSGDARNHTDYTTQSAGIIPGNAESAISVFRSVLNSVASLKLDSDGNTQSVVHSQRANLGNGCPLCGSLNARGDYP